MVPHVGISQSCQKKKAYFLGYMVHRLLMVALGRRDLDDRDHYDNMRFDLSDPLMAFLFSPFLKTLMTEVRMCGLKLVNQNKPLKMGVAN